MLMCAKVWESVLKASCSILNECTFQQKKTGSWKISSASYSRNLFGTSSHWHIYFVELGVHNRKRPFALYTLLLCSSEFPAPTREHNTFTAPSPDSLGMKEGFFGFCYFPWRVGHWLLYKTPEYALSFPCWLSPQVFVGFKGVAAAQFEWGAWPWRLIWRHVLPGRHPAGAQPLSALGWVSDSCPPPSGAEVRCGGGLHIFSCGFGSFAVVNDKTYVNWSDRFGRPGQLALRKWPEVKKLTDSGSVCRSWYNSWWLLGLWFFLSPPSSSGTLC